MADSFNCPKCGAPLNYNAETQGHLETITCPYCSETVIIPPEMRKTALDPSTMEVLRNLNDNAPYKPVTTPYEPRVDYGTPVRRKNSLGGCIVTAVIIAIIIAVVVGIGTEQIKNSVLQAINPSQARTPQISSAELIQTQMSPIIEQVTQVANEISTVVPETPALKATPVVNFTATAGAQTTRIAQNMLVTTQRNWPVVVQDKFATNKLNWNTGIDNNDMALEDITLAGNKYTWKFTTKQSMGSFSYPDMPEQTDLFVSVDLQMIDKTGNSSDQAGIIFRHSNKDKTFYFFAVNPAGTYSLSMYNGSDWNDLIPVTETGLLNPNEVNHVAASMQGDQIILVINNTVVDSFEDAQLSSGSAGLGINLPAPGEDATVIFSNFYVRAPGK